MPAEPTAVVPTGPRRLLIGPHGPRLLLGIGLAVLTYALFPEAPATQIPIYEVGAVATDNVIAPFAYEVPKTEQELQREREDVARAAQPVFRFVPEAADTSQLLLDALEESLGQAAAARPANIALIERSARPYGVVLSPAEAAYLASPSRTERLMSSVRRVFDRWVAGGVVPTGAVDQLRGEVLLRRGAEEHRLPADSLFSFGQLISQARLVNLLVWSIAAAAVWTARTTPRAYRVDGDFPAIIPDALAEAGRLGIGQPGGKLDERVRVEIVGIEAHREAHPNRG